MSRVFRFDEDPDSRRSTKFPPAIELRYTASSVPENSDAFVRSFAAGATPALLVDGELGILYRQDINVEPDGHQTYRVKVPYGPKNRNGGISFGFDTTGGTTHVNIAKEHIASFPADSENPDPFQGAIGVERDGSMKGADVVIPMLKFNITYRHVRGIVNLAYARRVAAAVGCKNASTFLNFQRSELLFLRAQGQDGADTESEVNYQFAADQNITGLTQAGISGIAKDGHDVLWFQLADDVASGAPAITAKRSPRRASRRLYRLREHLRIRRIAAPMQEIAEYVSLARSATRLGLTEATTMKEFAAFGLHPIHSLGRRLLLLLRGTGTIGRPPGRASAQASSRT